MVRIAHGPSPSPMTGPIDREPEFERAFARELYRTPNIHTHGWIDVFRRVDPRPEQYTWWSNRGASWEKNVGWRIDYQIATGDLAANAQSAVVGKAPTYAERWSDHAPLTVSFG